MVLPVIDFTNQCCDRTLQGKFKVLIAALVVDAVATILCLVLGVLGLLSLNGVQSPIVGMSPAAAYAFIGVGSGIALLYVAMAIKSCIERCPKNQNL